MYWSYYLLIFCEHHALSLKISFWTWWSKIYHQYHYYCYRNLNAALLRCNFPKDVQGIGTQVNSFFLLFLQAWEALALPHNAWGLTRPEELLESTDSAVTKIATVNHCQSVTQQGIQVPGWFTSWRCALERGKSIKDYFLTLLHTEPPKYFIYMAFLHLRGCLPFKWHLGIWGPLAIFFLFFPGLTTFLEFLKQPSHSPSIRSTGDAEWNGS